jgi:hypothetical protein
MVRARNAIMRGKFKLAFLVFAIGMPVALASAQGRIVHFPKTSAQEGTNILLEANLEGTSARVGFMRIYYKYPQQQSYRYRDMRPEIDHWVGMIPAAEVTGDRLQYFISAFLDNQAVLTHPENNPYNNPAEIQISAKPVGSAAKKAGQVPLPDASRSGTSEAGEPIITEAAQMQNTLSPLLLLTPEPDESLASEEVVLAVSLTSENRAADSSTVQVFMDGVNITRLATISSYLVSFEPAKVKPGRHWFKVTAKDSRGKAIPALMVNFKVRGESESAGPQTQFQGHVFSDLRQENVNSQNESFAMGGSDFSGQYGVLQYSGQVFLTSLEDKNYQPRDRYQFSLNTKLIGASFGDVHPNFNDLILWGKRVRGLSGYVHLGFFNIDAVYGETYRKVEGIDSSRYGTFRQTVLGIRPSFGSGRHFQLGLSLVKVKDDTASIKYGSNPKDNLVFGPDLRISFDRGRFVIQANGAFSLLTNNIYPGPISADEIKDVFNTDIPIDPAAFEDYLILNDSTTPLDPSKLTSLAYNAMVKLNYFQNMLTIGYKSVGSEYTSLANNWLRKDIQGFYFNDRLRLFKNKLYLTFGYEDYIDNFSQDDASPSLDLKTLNYAITIYPGPGLPYLNVSMRDHYRDNGINSIEADTLYFSSTQDTVIYSDGREKQIDRDFALQLGYDAALFDVNHTISLSFMNSGRTDDYKSTRLGTSASQELSTNVQMISLRTSYHVPLRTTISYSSNKNSMSGSGSDFNYSMFGLLTEYNFLNGKLATFAELRMTSASATTSSSAAIDYDRNHYRIGGNYQISPRQIISLDANWIHFNDNANAGNANNTSYTDGIYRIRYEKYF